VRGFKPTALAAKLSTTLHSSIRNTSSDNVVALLPGSQRSGEVIVYSAHWDHFGKNPAIKGDNVFHGAGRQRHRPGRVARTRRRVRASGAETAALDPVPRADPEEAGLIGSRYYAMHPSIPMAKTVAEINMDMFIPYGRTHDMSIVGFGESQMDDYLKEILAPAGRTSRCRTANRRKGYFYRSDQINFARKGVPVLYVHSGLDKLDGGKPAGPGRERGLHEEPLSQAGRSLRSALGPVRRDRRRPGAVRRRQAPRG
jgi:hypothetical protein